MNLEVESVYYSYTHTKVLNGIYFKTHNAEITGMLGRNGCGKTTFLKIIYGFLKAPSSIIRIDNVIIPRKKLKYIFSYLPQVSFLPRFITVNKAITIFMKKKHDREFVKSDSKITPLLSRKIKSLSGGEKRYLEFLLVFSLHKQILLLDEPFSTIEPIYTEKIITLLKENHQKKIIILTDHDYKNILLAANRYIILWDGKFEEIKSESELRYYHYLPE